MSLKTRFDVFKRDDFTCRYCGRKTPSVVLQVDHVIPVAEGGDNEIENLVTSCFECNNGKGAGLLENLPSEIDVEAKSILMAEHERQLREYNEVKRLVRQREDADIGEFLDYWEAHQPGYKTYYPQTSSIRNWLKRASVVDLIEAAEITFDYKRGPDCIPYFFGVMRRRFGQGTGEGENES
jgi:hypothetical protein